MGLHMVCIKSGIHVVRASLNANLNDGLAERSKAVAQGAIPKGRGFEPHSRHIAFNAQVQFRALFIDAQQHELHY